VCVGPMMTSIGMVTAPLICGRQEPAASPRSHVTACAATPGLAMLAAIRPLVSNLAADRPPGSSSKWT